MFCPDVNGATVTMHFTEYTDAIPVRLSHKSMANGPLFTSILTSPRPLAYYLRVNNLNLANHLLQIQFWWPYLSQLIAPDWVISSLKDADLAEKQIKEFSPLLIPNKKLNEISTLAFEASELWRVKGQAPGASQEERGGALLTRAIYNRIRWCESTWCIAHGGGREGG